LRKKASLVPQQQGGGEKRPPEKKKGKEGGGIGVGNSCGRRKGRKAKGNLMKEKKRKACYNELKKGGGKNVRKNIERNTNILGRQKGGNFPSDRKKGNNTYTHSGGQTRLGENTRKGKEGTLVCKKLSQSIIIGGNRPVRGGRKKAPLVRDIKTVECKVSIHRQGKGGRTSFNIKRIEGRGIRHLWAV